MSDYDKMLDIANIGAAHLLKQIEKHIRETNAFDHVWPDGSDVKVWDRFLAEASIMGVAVKLMPYVCHSSTNAQALLAANIIEIARGIIDPVEAGVVGLHELGHFATTPRRRFAATALAQRQKDRDGRVKPRVHDMVMSDEMNAWNWAEERMPPGYADRFAAWRDESLANYLKHLAPVQYSTGVIMIGKSDPSVVDNIAQFLESLRTGQAGIIKCEPITFTIVFDNPDDKKESK